MLTSKENFTDAEAREDNKERKKPFQVFLKGEDSVGAGKILKGFDKLMDAEDDCNARNARAEALEISARYEVRPLAV